MQIVRSDLGWCAAGTRVEVRLSGPANVRLIDEASYVLRQFGYAHVYYGRLATSSPVVLEVPDDDHWLVIVDLEGLVGRVEVEGVRTLRPAGAAPLA